MSNNQELSINLYQQSNSIRETYFSRWDYYKKTIKYVIYGAHNTKIKAMKEGRNSEGKFTKGHTGFKPKGAVSKKKQKLEQRLNLIFAQLEINMEESIKALSPRQKVKLWMDLTKLSVPKLKRIPWEPDPIKESEKKVIFEFLNSGESISDNPDLNNSYK